MSPLEIVGGLIALGGSLILVGAGIGLHRFEDVYMRIAAVGTAAGLGLSLVIAGSALVHPTPGSLVVVALAVLLQLVTSSVGAMVVARAAVNSAHPFREDTDTEVLGRLPRIGDADGQDAQSSGPSTS